ncbi:unnamed protein product [Rotaria socialis]|uniref:Transglutaminase-like domain-containing protein n=2 Tax=Rotaria socialis TaxID=392032 RepID=A0A820V6P4_9BILA|nr:unnamed protein product [Rotaria socialis]CAF4495726.1 unnamed protein product [Rotaria socialis]
MVNGLNLTVQTEQITVLIPPPSTKCEQPESGYGSSASSSIGLSQIRRPKSSKCKTADKKPMLPINLKHSKAVDDSLILKKSSKSPQVRNSLINGSSRLKTASSRISVDQLPFAGMKPIQIKVTTNRSRGQTMPSKCQQENVANYSDDWESNDSDDWESDTEVHSRPIFVRAQSASRNISISNRLDTENSMEDASHLLPRGESNVAKFKNVFQSENYLKSNPNETQQRIQTSNSSPSANQSKINTKETETSHNTSKEDLKQSENVVNLSNRPEARNEMESNVEEASQSIEANTINLIPSDPNAFDATFCQQRQRAIDDMSYRTAVKSWKADKFHDVVKLILELSSGKSLIDRAWIVFYWVSQNIEYDIQAFFSGNIRHQTADDIFTNRKGVCDAFGTIFKTLCTGVQLECEKISGYAKGYGFRAGQSKFSSTNHAWNAVHLYGRWYLVDSTWGEGHLDSNNHGVKELKTFYFLVRPEQMIYRHFPENTKWQLLRSPISMNDFLRLPDVEPTFFELGLDLVCPQQSSTVPFQQTLGIAEVLLRAPPNVDLMSAIQQKGFNENKAQSIVQYDSIRQLWQCIFTPHRGGVHEALIFAGRPSENKTNDKNSYSCVATFGLHVPDGFKGAKTFPTTYSLFTQRKCQIFEPLNGTLKIGSKVLIHCRIPGAHCARVRLGGNWLPEDIIKNDVFKRQITVPRQEVTIYVQFSDKRNSSSYDGLIKYSVQ